MKKILLVSPSSTTSPSFEYGVRSSLESLGHNISVFNYRQHQLHRFSFTRNLLNKKLLNLALKSNPDLVLVLKGEQIQKGVIENISNQGIKTANWILDDPFGKLNKFNEVKNRNEYDDFFVFDPFYVKKLKESGQNNAHYLPCATNTELYTEQIPLTQRKYDQDLSFIGTYQKNRGRILSALYDQNMKIWGYHWDKAPDNLKLNSKIQKESLHGTKNIEHTQKICKIFNQTKINMNVHYPHSIESVNIRTFDIPATKSFQLCDYFKEIPNLFKLNKEIVCYKNTEELNELTKYYLDNEEERNKISLAGYKRVINEHTVKHRMKSLLNTIKL